MFVSVFVSFYSGVADTKEWEIYTHARKWEFLQQIEWSLFMRLRGNWITLHNSYLTEEFSGGYALWLKWWVAGILFYFADEAFQKLTDFISVIMDNSSDKQVRRKSSRVSTQTLN